MHRVTNGAPLANRPRERFLTVNVNTSLGRRNRRQRVPVVGQSQRHDVEIAAIDELAEIQIRHAILVAIAIVDDLLGFLATVAVHVANGDSLNLTFPEKPLQVTLPHRSRADGSEDDPLARRHTFASENTRGHDHGPDECRPGHA